MIRIRHHSGQERLISLNQVECVYADAAGMTMLRMASGVEYTLPQTYESFVQRVYGKDIQDVSGPEPKHPEKAQRGPLGLPTGEQSPIEPAKGIEYGTEGYDRAKHSEEA